MQYSARLLLLFTVIILEGYIVLSTELLAIRETLPFVGSGTDTVSIIIAAVLMPLAFGYHAGGRFVAKSKNGKRDSLRKKLVNNLIISQAILFFGLSYPLLHSFFDTLIKYGASNRLILTSIYSLVFLVVPVYLLGQTVPLVSNYFSKRKLSEITGKMLFFSTIGSFIGATFSTLVLMSFIGVHYTAALNFVLLAVLVTLLERKWVTEKVALAWVVAVFGVYMNSDTMMGTYNIVENNKYNTIAVEERGNERHLVLNHSYSSMYSTEGKKYEYIEFIENVAIYSIPEEAPPKEILVIGAGAFTLGYEDDKNIYTYIDIDESLKKVAEEHILTGKLLENKNFYPVEARAFLRKDKKLYDVIVLDAYSGYLTIPEHLITADFFRQIKSHVRQDGLVLANFVMSPNFTTAFSQNLDNSFRSVFPHISRHSISEKYDLWSKDSNVLGNTIYIYRNTAESSNKIYTDNKNSAFYDRPAALPY